MTLDIPQLYVSQKTLGTSILPKKTNVILDIDSTLGYSISAGKFLPQALKSRAVVLEGQDMVFIPRPDLKKFLNILANSGQYIFIYSAGADNYVKSVVDVLKKIEPSIYFTGVFSRSHCIEYYNGGFGDTDYLKDLSMHDLDHLNTYMIDDRPEIIVGYYAKKIKINPCSISYFGEKDLIECYTKLVNLYHG